MKKIVNPNDIVESFVSDYRGAFADDLVSIIMYGSAATHEYVPGVSDINIAIVLKDWSPASLSRCIKVQQKWLKRGVAVPFFMTEEYIHSSADSYPLEFLDMKLNYRVLFGDDVLVNLEIDPIHIRLQCERELKGIAVHLRRSLIEVNAEEKRVYSILKYSVKNLMPVFKGVIVLYSGTVPNLKSGIIASIEDIFKTGASALSEVFSARKYNPKTAYGALANRFAAELDTMISVIDTIGG